MTGRRPPPRGVFRWPDKESRMPQEERRGKNCSHAEPRRHRSEWSRFSCEPVCRARTPWMSRAASEPVRLSLGLSRCSVKRSRRSGHRTGESDSAGGRVRSRPASANERLSRQKLDSPELVHDLVAAECAPPQGSLRFILLDTRYHLIRTRKSARHCEREHRHPRAVFRPG